VTPAPKKRPKSSYTRFAAELPNECWQSDMTHWHLEDGTPVEILTFLDDHSRCVLAIRAYPTVSVENVRRLFAQCCQRFGTPASVLTDNGAIYNATARGGRTGFESDLLAAGVLYKHSRPYHPQTCGKVERWHRTLKGFLAKRPAATLGELQLVLETPSATTTKCDLTAALIARLPTSPTTLERKRSRTPSFTNRIGAFATTRSTCVATFACAIWAASATSMWAGNTEASRSASTSSTTSSRSPPKMASSLVRRGLTQIATTNRKVQAFDSLHRFSCSRCRDRFQSAPGRIRTCAHGLGNRCSIP
jgi:transposase InsO family protein